MRKILLLTVAMLLCWWTASPQAVFYQDDFESYNVGDFMGVVNPTWWTTWSNDPGSGEDCYISDTYANSPTKSVFMDPDDGLADVVLKLGDKTSGYWEIDWYMYVESGYKAYYNIQHFELPGEEWAFEVYFAVDGTGSFEVGGETFDFTFPQDTWFSVQHMINIDADWASVMINGVEVHAWPFHYEASGTEGTNQLGAVNFWNEDTGNRYYIDDLLIQRLLVPFYEDDFEDYAVGDFMAVVNPTWWTTWGNDPGSGEDCYISDTYANSPTQSVFFDPDDGLTDAVLKLGDKTNGTYELSWYMYVESGYKAYYNIQHFETPGEEWAFDVFFTETGDGELEVGDETFAFTFPQDTWFPVMHMISVDADWATLTINGTVVHGWPFSYQSNDTTGTNQLGAVDFWNEDTGNRYYIDDVLYQPVPTEWYIDDFEDYMVGDFMAVVRPDWWITWSNNPGSGEDCYISDTYASSPTQSVFFDPDDGQTDVVLKLMDQTSGVFEIGWEMYIETGYKGYYNFQHFELPGEEWAFEVYFAVDGTGSFEVGGETFDFTFPQDTWFSVHHVVNIDADWATLMINGVGVHEWPFHYEASGTEGTNQLGGVNFWNEDAGNRYYIDDISVIQTIPSSDFPAIIEVSPPALQALTSEGTMTTKPLYITNAGGEDLEYQLAVFYDVPAKKTQLPQATLSHQVNSVAHVTPSKNPNAVPAPYNPPNRDEVLHYDGENDNAFSWSPNVPYTITDAAMFPASMVAPYVGMMISSVDLYIGTGGTDFSVRIYEMGDMDSPGELIYEQAFTPIEESWNNVVLDDPVYINGLDVWVGYQYTQPDLNLFIAGVDAGPGHPLGGFLTFDNVVWYSLMEDFEDDVNWNIRANLTGDPIESWLSVDPIMGTIAPGESDTITATFDATNLMQGNYGATVRISSNDMETPMIDVPAMLIVIPGTGTPEILLNDLQVNIHPNPANDYVLITSDTEMNEVEILNQLGQTVYNKVVKNTNVNLNITKFESGVYYVRVKSNEGTALQKLVIR
jgi:murein tripeptide amidase MpaA